MTILISVKRIILKFLTFFFFNEEPNRTELNASLSRRTALELFDYFCKKFGSIEPNFKMNFRIKMMNYVQLIGSIESSGSTNKKTQN